MANRNFPTTKQYSMHIAPVSLDGQAIFGAASISSSSGIGLVSITRLGVGSFKILLSDKYMSLLKLDMHMIAAVAGTGSGVFALEQVGSMLTNNDIRFHLLDAAGAAVDPVSGSKIVIKLLLNNSSVQ